VLCLSLVALAAGGSDDKAAKGTGPVDAKPAAQGAGMQRVTGIGGIFFKARDPVALRAWYHRHLGVEVLEWGGAVFPWTGADGKPAGGATVWNIAAADSEYFAPGTAPFMVNYRVADLRGLLEVLRREGVTVVGEMQESEQGRFGWVIDPEGNKVELWEPAPGH
jgi:predicted enzyme related to lactoylglutathione lyase